MAPATVIYLPHAKTKYGQKIGVACRIQVITNFAGIFSGNHFLGFFLSIFRKERVFILTLISLLNLF
jgi:hypothetical protein